MPCPLPAIALQAGCSWAAEADRILIGGNKLDYFLTEEQQMIQELTAQIAREKIRPVRAELDASEEFPWEIMKILAPAGLFGLYIPVEYSSTHSAIFFRDI